MNPTWTLASNVTITGQSVQYYADASCGVATGAPVTLSATATTDAFSAADLTTYSYKVTTNSAVGSITSACSSPLEINLMACVGARLTHAPYADGTGTNLDPYLICTPAQMNAIGANSSDWSSSFKLASDLDLSAYTGSQFNIIGNAATNFTGVFDGNGHTITNFTLNGGANSAVGMFGSVSGASSAIKNLTLSNVALTAASTSVQMGVLVGTLSTGAVSNCRVASGTISQTTGTNTQMVGGLIGAITGGTITNCASAITFGASANAVFAGGLVASAASSTISDSSFTGSIPGPNNLAATGGLVGSMSSTTVYRCFSTGNIVANGGTNVGGLIGGMSGSSDVTESFETGSVNGLATNIGGLVGLLGTTGSHGISESYAQGDVTTTGTANVGGLIGRASLATYRVHDSYATGAVTAFGGSLGALAGLVSSGTSANFSASFWNTDANPSLLAIGTGGALGGSYTAASLQDPTTFSGAGWTAPTWNLTTSGTYLTLGWQP